MRYNHKLNKTVFIFTFLLLIFAFTVTTAEANIAVDNSSSALGRDVPSLSWSHTVGAGQNHILIVGVSFRDASTDTLNSVTYGGAPLTYIGGITDTGEGKNRVEMWKLVPPAVGTNTIQLTFSGNVRVVGGAVSFTGVDQTTSHGAFTPATGTQVRSRV